MSTSASGLAASMPPRRVLPYAAVCLLAAALLWHAPRAAAQVAAGARRDVADSASPLTFPIQEVVRDARMTPVAPASSRTVRGEEFGDQRIVQRRAHVEPWSATADGQIFHTNNAGLTSQHKEGDWYLRTGAAISYTNRVRGPLFVDISLQQYFFRYREFAVLDFDLTRFEGGFLLEAPWLADSFFFARYRLERIAEAGLGSTLLTNHSLDVGVQKIWKISRGQQVFASLSADLALDTDPANNARHEYSASLGHSLRLTEHVSTGVSYRCSRYEYAHQDRQDWNHIFAAGITYDPLAWLRLGLTASYTYNDSSLSRGNYQNLVPGASLALRLAF